ncbi:unnamed protein product [Timema podura]|uniref:Peptidase M13 N-terminal domain-containing protein n=1 Tax=Timema podura TaxID=61482 RepID=A0ABN7PD46_TIMPD|nr:unnamed protein product [Timema podura]
MILGVTLAIVWIAVDEEIGDKITAGCNASLPEADRHDTSAIYRKLKLSQLQVEVPQLNWLEYLNAFLDADITEDEPVVSYAMPYFSEMGRIIQRTDRREPAHQRPSHGLKENVTNRAQAVTVN